MSESNAVKLTSLVKAGGCGSKVGPEDLRAVLEGLPGLEHPKLLFGAGHGDDASVYAISNDLALVQTVDFFTPIVDDPYTFGRIAAANALSDCFALGAKPITGLNVICIPSDLPADAVRNILRGGADVMIEAGGIITGGHSVTDPEPKYGVAVTGLVDPKRMVTNRGAKPGDKVILSKKIGIGIVTNLKKRGDNPEAYDEAIASMVTLNRTASEVMVEFSATACTDVTGYGLAGHAHNLALASGVSMVIMFADIPRFPGIDERAVEATKAGGGRRNRAWLKDKIRFADESHDMQLAVLTDPQTSGPLLFTVAADRAEGCIAELKRRGAHASAVIGTIESGSPGELSIL